MGNVVDHPSATRKSASLVSDQVANGSPCSTGLDLAIFLISRRCSGVNVGGRPPRYLGYSESNPSVLKVVDHIPDPVLAGERHLRDPGHTHALSRQQHHLRPPPAHH